MNERDLRIVHNRNDRGTKPRENVLPLVEGIQNAVKTGQLDKSCTAKPGAKSKLSNTPPENTTSRFLFTQDPTKAVYCAVTSQPSWKTNLGKVRSPTAARILW